MAEGFDEVSKVPEPLVSVSRAINDISSYNKFERIRFYTLEDAIEFVAPYQHAMWHIHAPLEAELSGELIDVDGVESLKLSSPERTGIVPRFKYGEHENGVSVESADKPLLSLWARLHYNVLDLPPVGMVSIQVSPPPPTTATLRLLINPEHGLEHGDLYARVQEAGKSALTLVMAVLDSDPNPPFSDWPR